MKNLWKKIYTPFQLTFLIILFAASAFTQEVTVFGQITTMANGFIEPVSNAHIFIDPDLTMSGYSDETGYYEITFLWLWNGPVQLTCEAEGYITHYETFFPDGDVHELNIMLELLNEFEFSTLTGTVYNAECPGGDQDCPIQDVMVSAWKIGSPMDVAFTAYSNEMGEYELELPIFEEYGYDWMVSGYHEYFELLNEPVIVGLEGAEHDIYLTPVGDPDPELGVYGSVYHYTDNGSIESVSWALIEVYNLDPALEEYYSVYSDDQGYYELEFGPGEYHLICSKEGFASFAVDFWVGNVPFNQNIFLEPYAAEEVVFTGIVYGSAGGEVPALINLAGAHVEVMAGGDDGFYAETYTNETGYFEFQADFPSDEWPFFHNATVIVSAQGYYQAEMIIGFSDWPVFQEFILTPLQPEDAWLFGQVLSVGESPDGELQPVGNAHVEIFGGFSGGLLADYFTGEDGYYEFGIESNAANLITVHAEGFEAYEQILPGYLEEPFELDIILIPEINPEEAGLIFGLVTAQLSPMGPEFPVGGALIWATPAWGFLPVYDTETDEAGLYELELGAGEIPWVVTCETEYGSETVEILLEPQQQIELNFHFNAWEYLLPPPEDLTAALAEDESMVWLSWESPSDWPLNCLPEFRILANNIHDPDHEWFILAETIDTEWEHLLDFPDNFNFEICYQVIAFCEDMESMPGNTACVESWELPFPPAPFNLNAVYVPEMGLAGSAVLNWQYPVLPDPEQIPVFNIYANLGYLSEYEFVFVGETEDPEFVYYFGDFAAPDNENCFRVNALVEDQVSEFSNTACVYLEEEPIEDVLIFGSVFYVMGGAIELIGGASIEALDIQTGEVFTTLSIEDGSYELFLPPGEYDVACILPDGELQQEHLIIPEGTVFELNFWFGEFPDEYTLSGMVYGILANDDLLPLNAEIIAMQDGLILDTMSNEGAYEIILPFPGLWQIFVSADGFLDEEVWVNVADGDEYDFFLYPLDDLFPAFMFIGDGSALPGEIVEIPLYIENYEPAGGVQFTISDTPAVLEAVEISSEFECFSVSFNDMDEGVIAVFFNTEGCEIGVGEHHFATITYQVSEDAQFGQDILLHYSDAVVSDIYGNEIPVMTYDGEITMNLSGDINMDGNRNVLDVVALINFIILINEPTEYQFWAADMNGDMVLDVLDVVRLVNIILDNSGRNYGSNSDIRNTAEVVIGNQFISVSSAVVAGVQIIGNSEWKVEQIHLPDSWLFNYANGVFIAYSMGEYIDDLTIEYSGNLELQKIIISNSSGDEIYSDISLNAEKYVLLQNYPNPFNPTTIIEYYLHTADFIELSIFDLKGRLVRNLYMGYRPAGTYTTEWNGTDRFGNQVPAGVYIYRLLNDGKSQSRKMILVK